MAARDFGTELFGPLSSDKRDYGAELFGPLPPGESGFIPSVMRGGRGIYSLLGDVVPAMAAHVAGYDDYAEKQMKEAAAYQEETARKYPSAVPSYTDIKGPGDALTYIIESVGEAIPSMIPSILTGGVAGLTVKGSVAAATAAAEKFAAAEVAKAAAKGIITKEATDLIAKNALAIGMKEAQRIALKAEATGALAGSAVQNVPDVYQNIYEKTGKQDIGATLVAGGFNSVLDALTPIHLLSKARKAGLTPDEIGKAWFKRMGIGAGEGLVTEGGTEGLQEISSIAAENFVAGNPEFFNRTNFDRVANATLKGGLGGGAITSATNVAFGKGPEKAAPPTIETPPPPPGVVPPATTAATIVAKPQLDEFPDIPDFTTNAADFKGTAATPPASAPVVDAATLQGDIDTLQTKTDTRAAEIAGLDTTKQPGLNKVAKQKEDLDLLAQKKAQLVALGETNAGQPTAPAGGTSVPVSKQPDTGAAPTGVAAVEPTGMVPTKPNVGAPVAGKGIPPITLTPTETVNAQAPETVQAEPQAPKISEPLRQVATKLLTDSDRVLTPKELHDALLQPDVAKTWTPEAAPALSLAEVEKLHADITPTLAPKPAPVVATTPILNKYTTEETGQKIRAHIRAAGKYYDETAYKSFGLQNWQSLSVDAKNVYLDNLPSNTPLQRHTTEQKQKALVALAAYKSKVKAVQDEQDTAQGKDNREVRASPEAGMYERNRAIYRRQFVIPYDPTLPENIKQQEEDAKAGRKTNTDGELVAGIEYPTWDQLSDEQRQAYKDTLASLAPVNKKTGAPMVPRTNTEHHDAAFNAVTKALKKDGYDPKPAPVVATTPILNKYTTEEQQKPAEVKTETTAKTETAPFINEIREPYQNTPEEQVEADKAEKEIQAKHQARLEANKGKEGKEGFIPKELVLRIKDGEINPTEKTKSVLNWLVNAAPSKLYREIAKVINKLGIKTAIKFVNELPKGHLAEYDPQTDTILVTSEGLRPTVLLHELVHAATVKVINKYLAAPKNQRDAGVIKGLTDTQIDAVQQLQELMNLAKDNGMMERFPASFKNLYEFVSSALTDAKFQTWLSDIPIEQLENTILPDNKSLLSKFMDKVIKIIGLEKLFSTKTGQVRNTTALTEAFAAFESIITAPEGGIDMAPLPATKTVQAPPATPVQTAEEKTKDALGQVATREQSNRPTIQRLLTTKAGGHWLITKFADAAYVIHSLTKHAELLGILERTGAKINDVGGQLTTAGAEGIDIITKRVYYLTKNVNDAIGVYADKVGVKADEAMRILHLIGETRHEPERRYQKFLNNVPLDGTHKFKITYGNTHYSADGFRDQINHWVVNPPANLDATAIKARSIKLHDMLVKLVEDKSNQAKTDVNGKAVSPELFDKNNVAYDVIAGRSPADIKDINSVLDKPEYKVEIDAVFKALQVLQTRTIELNTEAGYHSRPVQSLIEFYGFKNYIPFKGRPMSKEVNEEFNYDSKRMAGGLQDKQSPFAGRESESENSIAQVLADAASAGKRLGSKDLLLAIKNAVNPKARILHGEVLPRISFEDRHTGKVDMAQFSGADKVWHYNEDGSIDVIKLTNEKERVALRKTWQKTSPVIDFVNGLTSAIGQGHTRYNFAFAPKNYVTDTFTNAFVLGAEMGPMHAVQLVKKVAADTASNFNKAFKFTILYAQKSPAAMAEIKALAGGSLAYDSLNAEQRYYRDLSDYIEMGGKVSHLQSISTKSKLDELTREVGRSGMLLKKDQVDKFFDIYNEMFELSGRVSTYRMLKEEYLTANIKKGMTADKADADARRHATTTTKNLANFEKVGEWGKATGAMFMFFRPAATGAVRAIEALAPAFGFNEKSFREATETEMGIDKMKAGSAELADAKKRINEAVAKKKEQQTNARFMSAGLMGLGAGVYAMAAMMAGDDDQGRNRVLTDDMARWTRYARFHIPGTETMFQIPWGFGLGAFASTGAQLAALARGKVTPLDTFNNILEVGMDSFLPLPISRISLADNPLAKAMDTVVPSALRPFFEYAMNLDGLGREIYNNRQSKYGDAYMGGDNIPEAYKLITRSIFNATGGAVDWSPNTLAFFITNYIDGVAKLGTSTTNMGLTMLGKKDFSATTDTLVASSFFGSMSNVDAREFSRVEARAKELDKKLNSLKDKPDMYARYIMANPNEVYMAKFYDSQVNGQLKTLRTVANKLRADPNITIRERKTQLDMINNMTNRVKRQLLDCFDIIEKTKY